MGGAQGEAYISTLNATGLTREETLAREAIQNSSDSWNEENGRAKPTIEFRRRLLSGRNIVAFTRDLQLESIAARRDRLGLVEESLLDHIGQSGKTMTLLFVEDFGTHGLYGDAHDPNSHFYRLLLSLGDSAKARGREDSGGSYGFGKAAYFLNSRLHTIVAYSCFRDAVGVLTHRLFGCGFFNRHEDNRVSYTGRAWFGLSSAARQDSPEVDPIEGHDACALANRLGFKPRDENNLGTSLLIVDSRVDLDALRADIETWWWPKILEHGLDVVLIDEEAESDIHPRPRRRDDLRPFIDAYQIATGHVEAIKPHQKLETFNRIEQCETGALGLAVLTPEQESKVSEERCNCVALVRGPRMVVEYLPVSNEMPSIAGCFVGHADLERYLKLAEPPAHNKWDPRADRLTLEAGKGTRVVKSALDRIKRKSKDFQNSAAPPAPPKLNRLTRLERALGRYFMTKDKATTKPEHGEAPVHLHFLDEPAIVQEGGEALRMKTRLEIRAKETAPDEMKLRLKLHCSILEEETHEGDSLPIAVSVTGVETASPDDDPTVFDFVLRRESKARFAVLSEPYDPNWTVGFRPELTPL
jgi:hypothetical protein